MKSLKKLHGTLGNLPKHHTPYGKFLARSSIRLALSGVNA